METTLSSNQQIPELLRIFEVSLRSGYNIKQSLAIIAKDMDGPAGVEAQQVANDLEAGVPLPEALDRWLDRAPDPDLDLMAAVIRFQLEVGGNLADKFNLLANAFRLRRGVA